MTVGAYLPVYIEIIKKHEFPCNGMMVWRDFLSEQNQVLIAVSFRHVAKELIVSTVFLYNIKYIFDRRGITNLCRNRISGCTFRFKLFILCIGCITVNSFRKHSHLFLIRGVQDAHCTSEKAGNILYFYSMFLSAFLINHFFTASGRVRSVRIGH